MSAFFSDGKAVILPLDHGSAIPVPGLTGIEGVVGSLSGVVDGFVLNRGAAVAAKEEVNGKAVCLRVDVYEPTLPSGAVPVFDVEDALSVGAQGVMHMLYPGHEAQEEHLSFMGELVSQASENGVEVITEVLPMGLGMPKEYTLEKVGFAMRLAAEMGASVVKTAFPTGASAEEFAKLVEGVFVPVIVLGGAAMGDDRALLQMVHDAIAAGASGTAIGRNIWQHEHPVKIAKAVAAIVHNGASVEAALELIVNS